ncbi:GNAT family N-acetyltransferase [Pseudalkalibacillus sp. SCS-8]|uniref:GNAT family N-acetyltransferase n=1 Tax=Pseudalkalibacillus nanhaiensis TaxID=3115291 RepID=UPI0032DABD85
MLKMNEENPEKQAFYDLFQTTGWDLEFTVDSLYEAISNSWYVVSVYENKQLVGYGRILSDGVYQAMICDLIVLPSLQGKGIGTKILERLLAKCKQQDIKMVVLMSARCKAGFYEKFGFKKRHPEAPGMIWNGELGRNAEI